MDTYKRTYYGQYSKTSVVKTYDSTFWGNYEFPETIREFGHIDFIDVSPLPTETNFIAVTSGRKVEVYHPDSLQQVNVIARFQKNACGAKFRSDGRLLAAGSTESKVKVFDYKQKRQLRTFTGHSGAVRRVAFTTGNTELVSFSDDKNIMVWDIPAETSLSTFREHTDFIRAGVCSPTTENIVLSGSYDHTVRMWDTRVTNSVSTFTHGFPVESVLFFNNGTCFAVAGGTELKFFDIVAGKMIKSFAQHHKTITCLALGDNNTRLLSGSLDKQVKIYNLSTYHTVASLEYPAPIVALGSTPKSDTLIVGMSSTGTGLLSLQRKKTVPAEDEPSRRSIKDYTSDSNRKDSYRHLKDKKLAYYDNLIRKFSYTKAVQSVITKSRNREPEDAIAVLREVMRRQGLRAALSGQTLKNLSRVIKFVIKYMREPHYHSLLVQVAHILIDVYEEKIIEDPEYTKIFKELQVAVDKDLKIIRKCCELKGILEMASALYTRQEVSINSNKRIKLSDTDENTRDTADQSPTKKVIVNVS